MTSSALSLIIISKLLLFECITRSLLVSLCKVKLIALVSWIFQASDILRSFITYFKYDPVLYL